MEESEQLDRRSILTYLSQFYHAFNRDSPAPGPAPAPRTGEEAKFSPPLTSEAGSQSLPCTLSCSPAPEETSTEGGGGGGCGGGGGGPNKADCVTIRTWSTRAGS